MLSCCLAVGETPVTREGRGAGLRGVGESLPLESKWCVGLAQPCIFVCPHVNPSPLWVSVLHLYNDRMSTKGHSSSDFW